jgi:FkbM family methyltransferase
MVNKELKDIHKEIKCMDGKMDFEYNEQVIVQKFIEPTDIILELGGNIGRVSLVISHILNDSSNLVVVESDPNIAKQLRKNRDCNNAKFHIIEGAISENIVIQKGWDVRYLAKNQKIPRRWKRIPNISYYDLPMHNFNTIVADCEGCFPLLIKEYPHILNGIKKILIENDSQKYKDRKYFYEVINKLGFKRIYGQSLGKIPWKDDKNIHLKPHEYFWEVYVR